ncbi:MAG: hypothetical protein PUG14_03835 [Acholeplasmatales bacterium]|nr:hypothetical protein [Acholeplasmatales bacterium]MDY4016221.1 hypothetical protein [Bacilli bacterium]
MKITNFGKKLIAFLAVFALLLGLTGCLDENDDKTVTLKEAQENVDAVLSKIIFDPTTRENVTSSFPLASKNSGYKDVVIEWSSSEEDIIAIEKNEEKGELTAKVTRPSTTDSRIPEGKDYVVVTLTVVAYQDAGTQRATGKKTIEFRVIAVDSQEATIANIKKAVLASMQERGVALSSNDKDAKVYYETYARILMHVPGKSMIVSDGTQSIVVFGTFDETKYPVNTLVKVKGDVYSYYGNIEFGSNVEVEILPETDSHANIKVCQYVDTEIEAYTTALTAGINNNDEKKIVDIEKLLNFSGATYRLYAKLVKVEAAPGDVYALEDPVTGTRVSIYKYTTNGETQTAMMEKFVGKYININVVTFDRYSTNNCYRVVWDGSELTEAGAPELTDEQKANIILSGISLIDSTIVDFELPTIENVTWSLKEASDAATLEGNKVTVTRGVEDVEVVFVATATVGTATETKEFTVVINKTTEVSKTELVLTATELFPGLSGTSYATYNGEHTLGGYTFTTENVLKNAQYNMQNLFQFKATAGVIKTESITVKKIVLVTYSTYDYDNNFTFIVAGTTLTPSVEKIATGEKSGNYDIYKYVVTVELETAVTGALEINKTAGTKGAGYVESITISFDGQTHEATDEDKAKAILDAINVAESVTENVELPTIENVTWSLKEASDAATLEGNVLTITRGTADVTITLVATAKVGEAEISKEFTLVIKKEETVVEGELVLTATELFPGLSGTSYATYNGEHTLGGYTFTTENVLKNTRYNVQDLFQFKAETGVIKTENITVKKIVLVTYSTFDYSDNYTFIVAGKTVTPSVEKIATGEKEGNYDIYKYVVTVELETAVTGSLEINKTAGTKGAGYVESITIYEK